MVEEEGAVVEDAETHYRAVFFCSRDQEPKLLPRSPLAEEQPNERHPRTGGELSRPSPIAGFDRQALRTSHPSRRPGGRSPHLTAHVSLTGVGKVGFMVEVVEPRWPPTGGEGRSDNRWKRAGSDQSSQLVRKTGRRRPSLPFCGTETPDPEALWLFIRRSQKGFSRKFAKTRSGPEVLDWSYAPKKLTTKASEADGWCEGLLRRPPSFASLISDHCTQRRLPSTPPRSNTYARTRLRSVGFGHCRTLLGSFLLRAVRLQ